MAYDNLLFTPRRKSTVSLDCSTSSDVRAVRTTEPGFPQNLRIYNAGSVVVYIECGNAQAVASVPSGATAGSMPVAAGATIGIGLKAGETHIAGITGSSTATIYVTPGEGL